MIAQVTQFMRPDGRQVLQTVTISDECQAGYKAMLESNCRLTAEVLMDGQISICIESEWGDYGIEVVSNGPEVISAIEMMLIDFDTQKYKKWVNEQMMEA